MAKSTVDVNVSTLPIVGRSFTNRFVFGLDESASDSVRFDAGVDAFVIDTAHGHSQGVLDKVKWVKQNYPDVQVIGGNVATGQVRYFWRIRKHNFNSNN